MRSSLKWITLALTLWASPSFAQTQCLVPINAAATPVVSVAAEGSHLLKGSPGCLVATYVTVGATGGFLMVFNLVTVPVDGPVTPIECIQVAANTTNFLNWAPQPPEWFSTGITVVFSTTGCFTKTISATAFFHGIVQ